jgi:hypothetical protein
MLDSDPSRRLGINRVFPPMPAAKISRSGPKPCRSRISARAHLPVHEHVGGHAIGRSQSRVLGSSEAHSSHETIRKERSHPVDDEWVDDNWIDCFIDTRRPSRDASLPDLSNPFRPYRHPAYAERQTPSSAFRRPSLPLSPGGQQPNSRPVRRPSRPWPGR